MTTGGRQLEGRGARTTDNPHHRRDPLWHELNKVGVTPVLS